MLTNPFARRDNPHTLLVGMTGVKMGDRLVQIGCAHGGRLAAVAAKVGLSGRAVAIVPDDAAAARARKGAEQEGVLVEIEIAPPNLLPADGGGFDVAIVDDTAGVVGALDADRRRAAVREVLRVLRPGGRVIFLGSAPRSGLAALLSRGFPASTGDPGFVVSGGANSTLTAEGFRSVRTLAEREGLVFVEGIKPR